MKARNLSRNDIQYKCMFCPLVFMDFIERARHESGSCPQGSTNQHLSKLMRDALEVEDGQHLDQDLQRQTL